MLGVLDLQGPREGLRDRDQAFLGSERLENLASMSTLDPQGSFGAARGFNEVTRHQLDAKQAWKDHETQHPLVLFIRVF